MLRRALIRKAFAHSESGRSGRPVEALPEVPFPSPNSWSAAAVALRTQLAIGYLADNNLPYDGP